MICYIIDLFLTVFNSNCLFKMTVVISAVLDVITSYYDSILSYNVSIKYNSIVQEFKRIVNVSTIMYKSDSFYEHILYGSKHQKYYTRFDKEYMFIPFKGLLCLSLYKTYILIGTPNCYARLNLVNFISEHNGLVYLSSSYTTQNLCYTLLKLNLITRYESIEFNIKSIKFQNLLISLFTGRKSKNQNKTNKLLCSILMDRLVHDYDIKTISNLDSFDDLLICT